VEVHLLQVKVQVQDRLVEMVLPQLMVVEVALLQQMVEVQLDKVQDQEQVKPQVMVVLLPEVEAVLDQLKQLEVMVEVDHHNVERSDWKLRLEVTTYALRCVGAQSHAKP